MSNSELKGKFSFFINENFMKMNLQIKTYTLTISYIFLNS